MDTPENADREIVRKLMCYDNAAWSELVREVLLPLIYTRKYTETLRRLGLDPEDLLAETYQMIHRNHFDRLTKFRFECSLKSWCYHIVHEAYGRILFRCERKKRKIVTVVSENTLKHAPGNIKDGYRQLTAGETRRQLNRSLAAVWDRSPAEAMVLLLREHLQFSSRETAQFLGKTVNHVDVLNLRAKKRMKQIGETGS